MEVQSAKQEALELIHKMPDDADIEEIMYQLHVLENIRRGRHDASNGQLQVAEEVLKDIQSW